MKIKVSKKMLYEFLAIIDYYNEFVLGEEDYLKKQLETCLNTQGYWSGCAIRVYYDKDTKEFRVENRF